MRTICDFTSIHTFLNWLLCRIPNLPQKIHQTSCSFGASPSRQIGLLQRFSSPQVMVTRSCLRKNMVGVFPLCKTSSGWWLQPLWKIWKSVGMIIPNWMESHKIHVPNHQPDKVFPQFQTQPGHLGPDCRRRQRSPQGLQKFLGLLHLSLRCWGIEAPTCGTNFRFDYKGLCRFYGCMVMMVIDDIEHPILLSYKFI